MFEFLCEKCGVFERYVDSKVEMDICECGNHANRIISAPTVKLEGITGSFPGAHDRWARIREENARIKARKNA